LERCPFGDLLLETTDDRAASGALAFPPMPQWRSRDPVGSTHSCASWAGAIGPAIVGRIGRAPPEHNSTTEANNVVVD
jgi:hypothetical protein